MGVEKLSLRKKIGLELFRKQKEIEIAKHELKYLFWECTLRCNLACKHCGSDCRKSSLQKDMPLEDFLNTIDNIRPHVNPHNTMIVITGGEPLLRNDLEECGLELYKREFPWGFVTNGLQVTEDRINKLLDAGLRSVTVSLDGLEASHNLMRGNENSFKKVLEAIQIFTSKSNEIKFDVVTCITPKTFSELNNIKELLISLNVNLWRIFTITPIGRAQKDNELQLEPVQFKQLFEFIKETRKEGRIHLNYGCEGYLGAYESEVRDYFFFCRAGVSVGSILVDGSISACPNLRANFIQGNIYKNNFMEVWNNKYHIYRDRSWMKTGECEKCNHFKYCLGNGMHLRDENGQLLFCHLNRIKAGE